MKLLCREYECYYLVNTSILDTSQLQNLRILRYLNDTFCKSSLFLIYKICSCTNSECSYANIDVA